MVRIPRTVILQDFRTRSLLESTRKIIALQGFDAVTMERVAEEAGIAKGGIYLYFRNKNQLVFRAIEEIASQMVQEIESRVDPKVPPWERLCQLVHAQMDTMEQHKDLLRTLLLDRRFLRDSPPGEQSRRLLKYRERHEGHIKRILDEGVRRKVFYPVDTARVAFYINEMTISVAQKRMLGLTKSSQKKEAQALIRFLALLSRTRKQTVANLEERL
ncbi:MAG: TetR/AcrR family transcriptional regulator [Deltaproteobacteria bacterium]|nr:TetR/AcrR family transcriptional regulator [Deltaproteobacteria bacterium]